MLNSLCYNEIKGGKNVKTKFYRCAVCGQIIEKVKETEVPVMCCGKPMQELVAGTTEASLEKHIPEYKIENGVVKVNVGAVEHPMTNEHYIEWVYLKTENGCQRKMLMPTDKPYVEFLISESDKVEEVYAYCNLHGLWKK